MELDEHWLHSHRRQVIKLIKDLSDARACLCNGVPKIKLMGNTSEAAKDIEDNIDALRIGVDDTIKMCAYFADELKKQMKEPHAKPSPIHATVSGDNLTPFQRMLVREGAPGITTLPQHTTKIEARLPKIAPFNLTKRKQRSRGSDRTYKIPL